MEPLEPGDPATIGPFLLLGRLGSGGMGLVYLGRLSSGRPVAIKVVHEHFAQHPDFRERFAREVRAARTVGGFWTAAVVDADPTARKPWLASEFIEGPTLDKAVSPTDPLPLDAVRTVGLGLVEALIAIHHANLIHRDLKPSNVVLAAQGPRVIDFGIARAMDGSTLTAPDSRVGTAAYMSPEQCRNEPTIGPAADIFSLGGVLVYAATGRGPFGDGPGYAILARALTEEPDLTGVPELLVPIVSDCLRKDPAARPGTQELLARLRTMTATSSPRTEQQRERWWVRRS